jgi:hypothetical protein
MLFAMLLGGISILCWIFEFKLVGIGTGMFDIGFTLFLSLFVFGGSTALICVGLGMSNFYSGYVVIKHVTRNGFHRSEEFETSRLYRIRQFFSGRKR